MKIALVDDSQKELDCLNSYFSKFLNNKSEISQFHSGEEFLSVWESGLFDIIVLDIFMADLTGIDVAKKIRESDNEVRLVFGTSSNEFASESYDVNACFYLKKPFAEENIKMMFDRLNLSKIELNRTVSLSDGQNVILRNVIYAEQSGHIITIHTKLGDDIIARVPFSEALPCFCEYKYFCSPLKGLLINFYEVKSQKDNLFIMSNDEKIPISRRKIKSVLGDYASFRFEQIRKESAN